ncbi:hypothetical protein E4T39_01523 [Aureobasidium subglaciale]|nr:hypothetical protein E4T39_01523 [Aureobasidium subglaciale]
MRDGLDGLDIECNQPSRTTSVPLAVIETLSPLPQAYSHHHPTNYTFLLLYRHPTIPSSLHYHHSYFVDVQLFSVTRYALWEKMAVKKEIPIF